MESSSSNTATITTTITTTTTTNTHQETSTLVTTTTITQPPQQLPCPRCHSQGTKFCYYKNYTTSQPRHFCRTCRRHWTHGGVLRNVPVGGGTRKNSKRKTPMNPTTTSGYCDTTFAPPEYQESQAYKAFQCHLTPPPVDDSENVIAPFEPNVFVSSPYAAGAGYEDGGWPFCGS